MKANELMIGDLVKFPNSDICHMVCAVQGKSVKVDNKYWHKADKLKPIPITPDILEQNGFMWDNLPISQYWEQYGLIIYPAGGGYRMNCGQNVSFKIDYVHELQHTMRLCGIDKEITL